MAARNCQAKSEAAATANKNKIGYVYAEEMMLWHQGNAFAGHEHARVDLQNGLIVEAEQHWENAAPKRRVHSLLEVSGCVEGFMTFIRPLRARADHARLFHTKRYVDFLEGLATSQPFASRGAVVETGDYAPMSSVALPTALLSVGACLTAIEATLRGDVDASYVLSRPPGHHATADEGMGFCVLGNVAIGVKALQQFSAALPSSKLRVDDGSVDSLRVAVIDFDVHHGNGTQEAFYADPSVLVVSVHQQGLYPRDTGYAGEVGDHNVPASVGTTINIPLPPGSGNGAYVRATETIIVPAIERFRPDIVFFSMGFDASAYDPLGNMIVSSSGFADCVTAILKACSTMPSRLPMMPNLQRGSFLAATGTGAILTPLSPKECAEGTQHQQPSQFSVSAATRSRLPIVAVHEGGYSPIAVPYAAAAVMDRLVCYTRQTLPLKHSSVYEKEGDDKLVESVVANSLLAVGSQTGAVRELLAANPSLVRSYGFVPPQRTVKRLFHQLPLIDPTHEELCTLPLQEVQPGQEAVLKLVRILHGL